jgi:hypothetical protein
MKKAVRSSGSPPIRRAWLSAIIEAAALLFHLVRGGVSSECRPRVGIEVLRDWLAGSPVAESLDGQ